MVTKFIVNQDAKRGFAILHVPTYVGTEKRASNPRHVCSSTCLRRAGGSKRGHALLGLLHTPPAASKILN